MSDILLRGLRENIHQWLREYARRENYSVNQLFFRLIKSELGEKGKEIEKFKKRTEAFRRINERREELYQKYGLFEDSTPLIREDRESH